MVSPLVSQGSFTFQDGGKDRRGYQGTDGTLLRSTVATFTKSKFAIGDKETLRTNDWQVNGKYLSRYQAIVAL